MNSGTDIRTKTLIWMTVALVALAFTAVVANAEAHPLDNEVRTELTCA